MNTKEKELIEYLANCRKANQLEKQIKEIDAEIDDIERAMEYRFRSTTLDLLAEETHKLRLRQLGLRVNLNTVERKILQFELAEELRD